MQDSQAAPPAATSVRRENPSVVSYTQTAL
jgi:hypothetical protein